MVDIPQILSRVKLSRRKGGSTHCAMCSMGGVVSTALARHVGSVSDKTIREHAYTPAVYDDEKNIKLGYMYGNPYDAILSVFRRNFQDMHSKAMNINSPTPYTSLKGVTIEAYLEEGIDHFNIERQFDNWLDASLTKHPTILIKYEGLSASIDNIIQFFECDEAFEIRQRNCAWKEQPAPVIEGFKKMYGDLAERIDAMPATKILLPAYWKDIG